MPQNKDERVKTGLSSSKLPENKDERGKTGLSSLKLPENKDEIWEKRGKMVRFVTNRL